MGKVIPKPKAPKTAEPVQQKQEEKVDETKNKAALYSRSQGQQTVRTSLRGVLNNTNQITVQRKTLLGE